MTQTPSPSPAPLPTILEYGIIWTLKKGNAIYHCSEGSVDMGRDPNGIPIIPSCGSSSNDDRDPESNSEEGKLSFYHTDYKWNNVEISFDVDDRGSEALKGFEIEARVYSVASIPAKPDDPDGPSKAFNGWVPYRIKSAKIISSDPNSGGTWIYPDDYKVVVDSNHPKQYGGAILFEDVNPTDKGANEKFRCGINDGPKNDGMVNWLDTDGNVQSTLSAYNYVDVFDDVEFGYIPRNSYVNKKMTDAEKFQFQPLYEDVKDPNGLAAPIYPMNAVTAFVPDGRESVTVTYTVSLSVVALDDKGKEIKTPIQNPVVTIKHTVEQDTSDYIGQLNKLGTYCQFQNPGGWSDEELSPNYNYDYPYTLVAGFDGVPLDGDIDTRGDDRNNEPLEKGDVLYIPSTGERYTWSVGDIPEEVTIINPGTGYKNNERAMAMYSYPTDHSFDKDRYPAGRPPRCFSASDLSSIPIELYVNIKTKNGEVVSATITDDTAATGWKDGDTVRIVGGNNNAELSISIKEPPGWSTKFIDKY